MEFLFVLLVAVLALYKSDRPMQIYIHRDGQQFGPYSVEEAKNYVASGSLLADDLAWHEGAADWAPLAQVVGVVSADPSPPAATPEQEPRQDWIPPRRTDNPSPSAAVSAQAPGNVAAGKTLAEPGKTTPDVVPDNVKRTTRKRSSANDGYKRSLRAHGVRNMIYGGLWCVGGTTVTVYTYESAASSPGGGTYFVAWGAILFGGIQFVKGFVQSCSA